MPSNAPGEKEVVAAIVNENSGFHPHQIFDLCREKLESNFVPSYLQLVDEIPKTASEKPLERFLLEAFDTDADNVINI
jgi:crotonobetaine/carnitine-CoA ligase